MFVENNRDIKVYNRNMHQVESYYIVGRNSRNKYQLISYPWRRIDHREYETPGEAFNDLSEIVSRRGSVASWCNLNQEYIGN